PMRIVRHHCVDRQEHLYSPDCDHRRRVFTGISTTMLSRMSTRVHSPPGSCISISRTMGTTRWASERSFTTMHRRACLTKVAESRRMAPAPKTVYTGTERVPQPIGHLFPNAKTKCRMTPQS